MLSKVSDNPITSDGKKSLFFGSKEIHLNIIESPLREHFKFPFANIAQGILLILSVIDRDSFDYIDIKMEDIKTQRRNRLPAPIILIGNKVDLIKERVVSTEERMKKEKEFGVPYLETSVEVGYNVNEAFHQLAEMMVENEKNKSLNVYLLKVKSSMIINNEKGNEFLALAHLN